MVIGIKKWSDMVGLLILMNYNRWAMVIFSLQPQTLDSSRHQRRKLPAPPLKGTKRANFAHFGEIYYVEIKKNVFMHLKKKTEINCGHMQGTALYIHKVWTCMLMYACETETPRDGNWDRGEGHFYSALVNISHFMLCPKRRERPLNGCKSEYIC